jgi:hypothetical protein
MNIPTFSLVPLNNYFEAYQARKTYSRSFLKNRLNEARSELFDQIGKIVKNPLNPEIATLLFTAAGSSASITNSLLNYLRAHFTVNFEMTDINSKDHKSIIQKISKGLPITNKSYEEIFKHILLDRDFAHSNPNYNSKLVLPQINSTIVLVPGALNELFKGAAFERAAKKLFAQNKIKYFVAKTSGNKSSTYNSQVLSRKFKSYAKKHPRNKLWVIAFSKGGNDVLHFLKNDAAFAKKYLTGFSTIASPILGTSHLNRKTAQIYYNLHRKLEKILPLPIDAEFLNHLKEDYRKQWFMKNHTKLPANIFYSALALESAWYDSHLYMIIAKALLSSSQKNDGLVDVNNAQFPEYFNALNLGSAKGHHLVSTDSSSFNQEALIEAHIIFLNYLGLIN